jgi:hypothetical protein
MGHGVPNRAMVMAMMRFLFGMMSQSEPPGKTISIKAFGNNGCATGVRIVIS